jgi:hypothetical protein
VPYSTPTAPPKGIAGYAWVVALHLGIGLSFPATLLLALVLPVAWLAVYHFVLAEAPGAYWVRVVVLCGRTKEDGRHACMHVRRMYDAREKARHGTADQ